MAASIQEAIQARIAALLLAAGTAAGTRVSRGRVDALSADEVPAINIRRGPGIHNEFGRGADHAVFEVDIEMFCEGDTWETQCDALHMQVHNTLAVDTQLPTLCQGLRCIRTHPAAEPGDKTRGRLTATYQAQSLVRITDLTSAPRGA